MKSAAKSHSFYSSFNIEANLLRRSLGENSPIAKIQSFPGTEDLIWKSEIVLQSFKWRKIYWFYALILSFTIPGTWIDSWYLPDSFGDRTGMKKENSNAATKGCGETWSKFFDSFGKISQQSGIILPYTGQQGDRQLSGHVHGSVKCPRS